MRDGVKNHRVDCLAGGPCPCGVVKLGNTQRAKKKELLEKKGQSDNGLRKKGEVATRTRLKGKGERRVQTE